MACKTFPGLWKNLQGRTLCTFLNEKNSKIYTHTKKSIGIKNMQVILNNKMGSAVNTIKDFKAFQLLGKQTPPPPPHMLYKMSKNIKEKKMSKQHLIHNLAAHNCL